MILVAIFVVVPIVEIYVIIQVGQVIGAVPTMLLLVVESLIGAWIVKREGRRAWEALQRDDARPAALPASELADAALVLVGGTLLLTPGLRHRHLRLLLRACRSPGRSPASSSSS